MEKTQKPQEPIHREQEIKREDPPAKDQDSRYFVKGGGSKKGSISKKA